jgi:pimeloyl-ACP methyl ester carboxylesterase
VAAGLALGCGLLSALGCVEAPQPVPVPEYRDLGGGASVGRVVMHPRYRAVHMKSESLGDTLSGTLYLPDGTGPFPAVVWVHGSGARERLVYGSARVDDFVARGIAVYSYDKRGVGSSGGHCCPVHFDLLANDALSAVNALRTLSAIDPDRIALMGVSQAGWIVPIAALRDPRIVAGVVLSGPTVTLGEESLFSSLTHDARCGRDGLTIPEADAVVRQVGPSGFDPRIHLAAIDQPMLFVYGMQDIHQPSQLSIDVVEDLRATGKDFHLRVFPEANHFMGTAGPCGDVPVVRWLPEALDWIVERLAEPRRARVSAR